MGNGDGGSGIKRDIENARGVVGDGFARFAGPAGGASEGTVETKAGEGM